MYCGYNFSEKPEERKISLLGILIAETLYRLDVMTTDQLRALLFPDKSYTTFWYHLNLLVKAKLAYKEVIIESEDRRWDLWRLTKRGMK